MKNESYVRLTIVSENLSSKDICSVIGLKCDNEWQIGGKRYGTKIKHRNNGCEFKSKLPATAELEKHIENLMKRLVPASKEIKSLSHQNDIFFTCVIYNYTDPVNPGLFFKKQIINTICSLGACLNIDLYMLNEEEDANNQ